DRRDAGKLLHHHRHRFDGPGGAGVPKDRVLPPRQAGRDRRDRGDFHKPSRHAHTGLYYWPVRLRFMAEPKRSQAPASAALARRVKTSMADHTVKAFTEELDG